MNILTPPKPARSHAFDLDLPRYRWPLWLLTALALFASEPAHAQQPLFTFVQISDSQPTDSDDQLAFEEVLDTIVDAGAPGALIPYPVDYVVFAGDLVDSGNDIGEWNTFVETMDLWLTDNGIPFRAVPGNHDRSTNFGNYNQFIGSPATWSMGSETFIGHNGIQVSTGWRGLRYIGINNTNGGNNVISAADLAAVNVFVPAAVAAGENIFLMTHHPHNESNRLPLAGILNTPQVVGYLRGHTGSPGISRGLAGVSNPNVWGTRSNNIFEDGAILYYEVFQNDLEAHVIELADNPSQLPSPVIIPLVHSLVPAGGGNECTGRPAGTACTSDGNPCTNDQCNGAGTCTHTANAAPCNDGLFCNGADTCSGGACAIHTGDPCTGGPLCARTCSETADTCNAPTGSACDDGNECTGNQCNGSGTCTSTALPSSTTCTSDGNPCTNDHCNGAGACTHTANTASCNDGLFCNGADSCAAGACSVHAGDPCTGAGACSAGCNEAGDNCGVTPGTPCSGDGNPCTNDVCDALGACSHVDTCGGGAVVFEEVRSGGSSASVTVATSAPLTAASGHLYLASIATKTRVDTLAVGGLGLTWTLVARQCAGRNQTGADLWMAQGVPSAAGMVTATLASAPTSAVITVSRYSSTATGSPIGAVARANTLGVAGGCSGGTDTASYVLNLATTAPDSVVHVTTSMRNRAHTPGAGYEERIEARQGASGSSTASLALSDRTIANPVTNAVGGAFDGSVDWAVIAVEILAGSSGPPPTDTTTTTTTTTTTQGSTTSSTTTTTTTPSGAVSLQQVAIGTSSGVTTVATSAPLTAAAGHLYLAAVSTKSNVTVNGVSGLGLVWTQRATRCAGRNQTGVSVWSAQGVPSGNSAVTATLGSAPSNAAIAVSHYAGVGTSPLGSITSANSNGVGGACSGGVDGAAYAFSFTTTIPGAVVFVAPAMRAANHTPGAGYLEQAEVHAGSGGGSGASVAVVDRTVAALATVSVNGAFSSSVDWAVVALEIRP